MPGHYPPSSSLMKNAVNEKGKQISRWLWLRKLIAAPLSHLQGHQLAAISAGMTLSVYQWLKILWSRY